MDKTLLTIGVLNYIIESIILVVLMWPVPANTEHKVTIYDRLTTVFLVLLLFPLYFPQFYEYGLYLRTIYRFFIYIGYIRATRHPRYSKCVYYASVAASVQTAHQNIWVLPIIHQMVKSLETVSSSPLLIAILVRVIAKNIIFLSIVLLFNHFLCYQYIEELTAVHLSTGLLTLLCGMITRGSLTTIAEDNIRDYSNLFSINISLFILLSLCFLVLLDKSLHKAYREKALLSEETANRYRIQNLEAQAKSMEEVQALRHDIKNHMIALSHLSENHDDDAIQTYINSLMDRLTCPPVFHCGCPIADGLLSQKAEEALSLQIDFKVNADLSSLVYSGYRNVDLCTIFGNTLDNAFDAAAQVPEVSQRFVSLRSREQAGFLSVTITNQYSGQLRHSEGRLLTTKNTGVHGLGLKNVHHALRRYHGNMEFDTSEDSVFRLTLLFPIHQKEEISL